MKNGIYKGQTWGLSGKMTYYIVETQEFDAFHQKRMKHHIMKYFFTDINTGEIRDFWLTEDDAKAFVMKLIQEL